MANNIKGNAPNAVVAKATVSFVDAGINGTNTEVVYLVDDPLLSYVPGRAINGISGFVANKGYYMVAKVDMDLSAYLVPPIAGITQLGTPTNFTATVISDTQINLAWDAVANATSYTVERATNSSFTTGLTSIYTGSGTSYNNTGLIASTTYYYRVKATGAGYVDSNYATSSATTSAAGGSAEAITWTSLANATAPGGGDLVSSGTTAPAGGTATKKIGSDGSYVQMTIPATASDSVRAVLLLDDANDSNYDWVGTGITLLAGVYRDPAGQLNVFTGNTSGGSATQPGVTLNAGDIIRMEKSGNNVLVKHSTNGGSSFTLIYTFTGVLSGVTNIYIKGALVLPFAGQIFNDTTGFGLLT